jgi:hypothetical protein
MFKKFFVRGFVIVAVLATGGVAFAAVQGSSSGSSPAQPAVVTGMPVADEATVRDAIMSACGGRALVGSLPVASTDRVDHLMAERALHAAALAGNPINAGTGFQAGVDDALHVQAIDRELADLLCP